MQMLNVARLRDIDRFIHDIPLALAEVLDEGRGSSTRSVDVEVGRYDGRINKCKGS